MILNLDKLQPSSGPRLDRESGLAAGEVLRDQADQLRVGLAVHRRRLELRDPMTRRSWLVPAFGFTFTSMISGFWDMAMDLFPSIISRLTHAPRIGTNARFSGAVAKLWASAARQS